MTLAPSAKTRAALADFAFTILKGGVQVAQTA
jgi:hypothetical protein